LPRTYQLSAIDGPPSRRPRTAPLTGGRRCRGDTDRADGEDASRLRSDPFASVRSAGSASPFTDAGRTERGAARHEPSASRSTSMPSNGPSSASRFTGSSWISRHQWSSARSP